MAAPDLNQVHETLQNLAVYLDWEELRGYCSEINKSLGPFHFTDASFKFFPIDFSAQLLVPAKELHEFVPFKTTGDGSCLFRSFSILVNGDESKHLELRIRCIIELVNNEDFYLGDEDLAERIRAQERILGVNNPSNVSRNVLDPDAVVEVFREEVRNSVKLGFYASFWHLQAMGTVLKRKIKSVYPETTPEVRCMFHCVVVPREYRQDKPPLSVLWSRNGEISPEKLKNYIPNHFVPLVSRNNLVPCSYSDAEMTTLLPCPHPDCSQKESLFKDLQSHYRAIHEGSLDVGEAEKTQKERRKQAMINKVLNASSTVIGGEIFSVSSIGLNLEIRDISHYHAASKCACILLADDHLFPFSSPVRQEITVNFKSGKVIYHAWKKKSNEIWVPEIECLRTFANDTVEDIPTVHTCSSAVMDITATSVSDVQICSRSSTFTRDQLNEVMKKEWGFQKLKDFQTKAFDAIISGRDCFVSASTGGGKSLLYQLPSYLSVGLTVVVTPLKSLIVEQVIDCNNHNVPATTIHGEMDDMERQGVYFTLRQPSSTFKILYVTPEILTQDQTLLTILVELDSRGKLQQLVIDEAHCVSQWGNDFRESYAGLGNVRKHFSEVPVLMLTATATKATRDDVLSLLGVANAVCVLESVNRPNISYEVHFKSSKKVDEIIDIVAPLECSLVFCTTRKQCEELSPLLEAKGIKCKCYHGGLDQRIRQERQQKWKEGTLQCLVCTNAFGMGINKPNIRAVVHFSLPASVEDFIQESGRADRDGLPSKSVLFCSQQDKIFHIHNIHKLMKINPTFAKNRLYSFNTTVYYGFQQAVCRRAILLQHFGESSECSNCDVCQKQKRVIDLDITEVAKLTVQIVQRSANTVGRSHFTLNHFAKVLTGKKVKFDHDKFPEYGCFKETIETGENVLQYLVVKDILKEIPPDANARNQNAIYVTLGSKFIDGLSGQEKLVYKKAV